LIFAITQRWLGRLWEGVRALAALCWQLTRPWWPCPNVFKQELAGEQDFQYTEYVFSM